MLKIQIQYRGNYENKNHCKNNTENFTMDIAYCIALGYPLFYVVASWNNGIRRALQNDWRVCHFLWKHGCLQNDMLCLYDAESFDFCYIKII